MTYEYFVFVEGYGKENYDVEIPRDHMQVVRLDIEMKYGSNKEEDSTKPRIFTNKSRSKLIKLPMPENRIYNEDEGVMGVGFYYDDINELEKIVKSFNIPFYKDKVRKE